MTAKELQKRTKRFAALVIAFAQKLPHDYTCEVIMKQMIRSATSVAVNYRAAGRTRSRAEFSSNPGIVEEEADETLFWIEMLIEAKKITEAEVAGLLEETIEIVAIFSTANKTAKLHAKRITQH